MSCSPRSKAPWHFSPNRLHLTLLKEAGTCLKLKTRDKHETHHHRFAFDIGLLTAVALRGIDLQRRPRVKEAIKIHAIDEILNVNRPAVR